jgi:hypothetical protein
VKIRYRHSATRRAVLPVYGVDQLVFVGLLLLLCAGLSILIGDWISIVFLFLGGYIGYCLSMTRSAPCVMELHPDAWQHVVSILDESRYLVRGTEPGTWNRNVSIFRRWQSDLLRVTSSPSALIVEGRQADLIPLERRLRSVDTRMVSSRDI